MIVAALGEHFRIDEDVASFVYGGGRDLTGYEDGTENPKGERAVEVALADRQAGARGRQLRRDAEVDARSRAASSAVAPGARRHHRPRSRIQRGARRRAAVGAREAHRRRRASSPTPSWCAARCRGATCASTGSTSWPTPRRLDPFERVLRRMARPRRRHRRRAAALHARRSRAATTGARRRRRRASGSTSARCSRSQVRRLAQPRGGGRDTPGAGDLVLDAHGRADG